MGQKNIARSYRQQLRNLPRRREYHPPLDQRQLGQLEKKEEDANRT